MGNRTTETHRQNASSSATAVTVLSIIFYLILSAVIIPLQGNGLFTFIPLLFSVQRLNFDIYLTFFPRIRKLEDVDVKRLEVLRAYSEDCYKAVIWLRENRDMFEHPVYEPMMLEVCMTLL